ncbi:glycosyltransferase [Loktanella sp. IMCC34160]|uniref:glycosyltransferase n=1 Tax=Loktanella sp. IMCC34160 TaxID=2510646 RepID=UPI00101CAF3B|nr:glycosyltransferase [Loktanella sp. IMCC34160]RYG92632.1 glycosyltransferase [Loktanella sp. IMCC34160]
MTDQTDEQKAWIVILMATYDGAPHLAEQLNSIAAQTYENWSLLVGDDGSNDGTLDLLEAFGKRGHKLSVIKGPGEGSTANFMALLQAAAEQEKGGCIAFCDQDDVWLPDKLERAVERLRAVAQDVPALYCSRSWVTDAELGNCKLSVAWSRPLGFRNAIVQNVAAGNTIVLNPTGSHLVLQESKVAGVVVVHDWWIYQIISGAGGRLIYDDLPTLLYRQHGRNVIGANTGLRARLKRIRMLLDGTFCRWSQINVEALNRSKSRFTPENQMILDGFALMRRAGILRRLRLIWQLRLYRQTWLSTAALWLAVLIKRI